LELFSLDKMDPHHYYPCVSKKLRLIPDHDTAHANFPILNSVSFGQA